MFRKILLNGVPISGFSYIVSVTNNSIFAYAIRRCPLTVFLDLSHPYKKISYYSSTCIQVKEILDFTTNRDSMLAINNSTISLREIDDEFGSISRRENLLLQGRIL